MSTTVDPEETNETQETEEPSEEETPTYDLATLEAEGFTPEKCCFYLKAKFEYVLNNSFTNLDVSLENDLVVNNKIQRLDSYKSKIRTFRSYCITLQDIENSLAEFVEEEEEAEETTP